MEEGRTGGGSQEEISPAEEIYDYSLSVDGEDVPFSLTESSGSQTLGGGKSRSIFSPTRRVLMQWFQKKLSDSLVVANPDYSAVLLRERISLYKQSCGVWGGANPLRIFTAKELYEATKGFSSEKLIKSDSCYTYYSGYIDGGLISVKLYNHRYEFARESFTTEITMLSSIQHVNIIQILGYCLEGPNPMIVYEFPPNGSLHMHIEEDDRMPWSDRLRIAIQVAEAVAYLHFNATKPIIHRDIKPAHVWLDENYNAKLSGFDCSIAMRQDETTMQGRLRGTYFYFDPEYVYFGEFTEKSDVYSFGVLLLWVLHGNNPTTLITDFLTVTDSAMNNSLQAQVTKGQDILVLESLIRECTREKGAQRPSMIQVTKQLHTIRDMHPLPKVFDFLELYEATHGFTTQISNGMYIGILEDHTGVQRISVKLFSSNAVQEIEALSSICHLSVVTLLGYCMEDEENTILVYAYPSNQTIDHHINLKHSSLAWSVRLRIATEVAEAIAYIHSKTPDRIIHRQITTSNIWLTETYNAKLSGFEHSVLLLPDETRKIDPPKTGAAEFLDPEYKDSRVLTEKVDVYSFGILLLWVLHNRDPSECLQELLKNTYEENEGFTNSGSPDMLCADSIISKADENINNSIVEGEATSFQILALTDLIKACTTEKGARRPSMLEVTEQLLAIRHTSQELDSD